MRTFAPSLAIPSSLLLALALAGPASAQQERYQLERTEDGYVRLDTQTGEMSRCEENGTELICRPASEANADSRDQRRNDAKARDQIELELETPDDAAPADEIDRLRDTVEALEQRIEALEAAKPVDVLPTEQEFERTMDYAERFLRRFMGVAKELDDKKPDSADEPAPNRT